MRTIEVIADWIDLGGPFPMGNLSISHGRGGEHFSFEYDADWLTAGTPHLQLDPNLGLWNGRQHPPGEQENFGLFLDSCPDRWGRVLMERREALMARTEGRAARRLHESDFLLGVHDGHRMGALRFYEDGRYLDDNDDFASPPWTSLRELQHASQQVERPDSDRDPEAARWLRMLIASGGSLGGARPKASVRDEQGQLWIAKFPSRNDRADIGGWEGVAHELAQRAGVDVASAQVQRFESDGVAGPGFRTFISRRFDRTPDGGRVHFASAMTLLGYSDEADASAGASYLELAELLIQRGANTKADLQQLWRRIVFSIAISNTDDHLRNHGFLLQPQGWVLSPAYDINPVPYGADTGLSLNISDADNSLSFEVALSVAEFFRLDGSHARQLVSEVVAAVSDWREVASALSLGREEQNRMRPAFQVP